MRTTLAIPAALVAVTLTLGGCSSDAGSDSSGSGGASSSSSSAGTTIEITIKGGKVTPHGDRVKTGVGDPVTLKIDADTAGEIHVHSSPEQEIEFPKGTSTKKLTIDRPGIVDVEDHALEQVIVQLEVS
jgi:predicted small secreted protein